MKWAITRRACAAQALMVVSFLLPLSAQATVITFEDLNSGGLVPQGYKGFKWAGGEGNNSWILATPTNGANIWSAHSGTNYVWSNGGTSLTMSDGLFDFNSMWVRTGGGQSFGTDTAHGFLNGVEIFTQQFSVSPTYSLITLNFNGINEITFDRTGFNLVVDDITVNQSIATPEPSTLTLSTLMATGLAGYFSWRRRRQVATA